jgi:hypothetical protein
MTPARVFMFLLHLAVAAGAVWLAARLVDWLAG